MTMRTTTTSTTTTTTTTRTTETVAFGLGSNRGPRTTHLTAAVERLRDLLGPLRVASLYESEALSPSVAVRQPLPPFLNTAVIAHESPLVDPEALLAIGKQLELAAGRRRGARWAPRTLDVDLLLVGDLTRHDAALMLPHPGLRARRFVLAPLAEIASDLRVPPGGGTVRHLLATLDAAVGPLGPPDGGKRDWPLATR